MTQFCAQYAIRVEGSSRIARSQRLLLELDRSHRLPRIVVVKQNCYDELFLGCASLVHEKSPGVHVSPTRTLEAESPDLPCLQYDFGLFVISMDTTIAPNQCCLKIFVELCDVHLSFGSHVVVLKLQSGTRGWRLRMVDKTRPRRPRDRRTQYEQSSERPLADTVVRRPNKEMCTSAAARLESSEVMRATGERSKQQDEQKTRAWIPMTEFRGV